MNKAKAMRWLSAAMLLLSLILSSCASVCTDTLEVHMLDVGNADCFLVKQGEAAMLIDGGEADDADKIVSYLHTHGVTELQAVVISHPHADHIGSMERVIKAYAVKTVYYATLPQALRESTPLHTRLAKAIDKSETVLCEASGGTAFTLGSAQVQIYPVTVQSEDANDYSLFARVTYGKERILFTGDATEKGQQALMNSEADITATILKMPHHGGRIDTNEQFVRRVDAELALIPCGTENDYGHPHEKTLALLEAQETTYYRADLCGDTAVTLDGRGERFIETVR